MTVGRVAATGRASYQWAAWGDLNAFFGLMLDNVTNLVLLSALLLGVGFPAEIFFTRMVPGTALGVLFGDLVYTYLAFRLARRSGNTQVTAMPLGLDTPSTIGMALAVLIPAFQAAQADGLSVVVAGDVAWKVGMATLIFMGLIKTGASFLGGWVQRVVPQAGLLGSLAGVGVTLLGLIPLMQIYRIPVVGLMALGLLLYTLVARIDLPGRIPGAFAAVAAGTILYYVLGPTGLMGGGFHMPAANLRLVFPWPTLSWLEQSRTALAYLPFGIPFGLLTIIGGINNAESARCGGDEFNTRDILLTEAGATLAAGFCGGVVQTTPYIGHPAYKAMGARSAYTLAVGLFVGLGGMLGYISWIVEAIPAAAVAPILLFVGMSITDQAYKVCPKAHYPALFLALLPSVGELVRIALTTVLTDPGIGGRMPSGPEATQLFNVSLLLGHGFIITAMLWGAALAHLIDRKLTAAAGYFAVMAGLTFFGFMHSVQPQGDIYFPWQVASTVPYQLAAVYLALAGFIYMTPHLRSQGPKGLQGQQGHQRQGAV